jgi:hypothetical protein
VKKIVLLSILILLCFSTCTAGGLNTGSSFTVPSGQVLVSFSVASDMRNYTGCNANFFRGVCEAIAAGGAGSFMVSAGDIDPPSDVFSDITTFIRGDYTWYPVVGNHDEETGPDMAWLRAFNRNGTALPNIVDIGPPGCEETTYSFDYGNAHFVVLNEYYDGVRDDATDGDIPDALFNWLDADLASTVMPIILVFGHEPAYPQPDAENGRLRHGNDSLNIHPENRDRFWQCLADRNVTAYICGHTHDYSVVRVKRDGSVDPGGASGVWQIDSGHARGTEDKGARSTFVMLYAMDDDSCWYFTYRLDLSASKYELTNSGRLR